MKYYLPLTLKPLSDFGKRTLDSSDFKQLVHDNQIDVILSHTIESGFYFYSPKGRHTIVISSKLNREASRWVSWHEFAHFLQNYWEPKTIAAGCKLGVQTDLERQANAFATIATTENLRMTDPLDYIDSIMGGGIRQRH